MPIIDLATLSVRSDSSDLNRLNVTLDITIRQAERVEAATNRLGKGFKLIGAAAAAAGAAIAAVGVTSVNVFRDLEVRLVGVQKTTDFTTAEMSKFGKEIDNISRRVPVATASLVDIAGVAGQLGIKGVDNVSKFTETVAKLSLATDIVGEEGAASIARLLNVTGEGIDTVGEFGAVLVALGNNSAATESEILSLATEVGQATSTFAVTSAETLALGAAMKSLGVSAELGGSVVGRAMREIEASISEGGEAVENLSRVTGIAAEDIKEQFGENATVVFQKWVEGIGGLIDGGMSAADALDMFNLRGEEVLKVLPTMAVNSELLAKSLGIANKELEIGTALNNEVAKATDTLDAQIIISKNIINDYAFEIGENLAPTIRDVIDDFRAWDSVQGDLAKQDIARWVGNTIKAGVELIKVISVIDEVLGIFLVDKQIDWANLVFAWERGTLAMSSSFGLAFDEINRVATESVEMLGGQMARLPLIGDDISETFTSVADTIRTSRTATSDYEKEVARLTSAHEANVRALKSYQLQQAETIESTFKIVEASEEDEKQSEKTADSKIDDEKRVVDAKERGRRAVAKMQEDELREAQRATAEKLSLSERLNVETKRLTEDEFWFKTWTLDREVQKMREVAGTDAAIQDDITAYHELKQGEILNNYNESNQNIIQRNFDTGEILQDTNATVVGAFIRGENVKMELAELASEKISGFALDAATEGLARILSALGVQVGANTALGVAQSSLDGQTWQQKLASGAAYLAGAGVAIMAGKELGNQFASGGWIGAHPDGGVIGVGTPGVDNVYLSTTGGVKNMGMKSEFVVNKEATAANIDALKFINSNGRNKRLFAEGGDLGETDMPIRLGGDDDYNESDIPDAPYKDRDRPPGSTYKGAIADPWAVTKGINDAGFDNFWMSVLRTRGNWNAAIAESIAFYGGTMAGMIAGQKVGPNIFADGGVVGVRNYGVGDLVDPLGINDEIEDITDPLGINSYIDDVNFGAIWEWLRSLPLVGDTVKRGDKILFPFVRDAITPGKSLNDETVNGMFEGLYSGLLDELLDQVSGGVAGGGVDVGDIVDPLGLFGKGGLLGSYKKGTDFVPATGFYELHKNEAVIPAQENIMAGGSKVIAELQSAVSELKKIVMATMETARISRKWDIDGLPETTT